LLKSAGNAGPFEFDGSNARMSLALVLDESAPSLL
jgi:hypothetical protein